MSWFDHIWCLLACSLPQQVHQDEEGDADDVRAPGISAARGAGKRDQDAGGSHCTSLPFSSLLASTLF